MTGPRTKQEKGQVNVEVSHDLVGFPVNLYFNRFRIDETPDAVILHVACSLPESPLSKAYSCAIGKDTIEQAKTGLFSYLDRLPSFDYDLPLTVVPAADEIQYSNVLSCSHAGASGEIALHVFSAKAIAEAARHLTPKSKVKSYPVALLRSPLHVHAEFLKKMLMP